MKKLLTLITILITFSTSSALAMSEQLTNILNDTETAITAFNNAVLEKNHLLIRDTQRVAINKIIIASVNIRREAELLNAVVSNQNATIADKQQANGDIQKLKDTHVLLEKKRIAIVNTKF